MTPDEVVKVLEEYYDEIKSNRFPNKYLSEKQIALQSAITLIQDYQKLREKIKGDELGLKIFIKLSGLPYEQATDFWTSKHCQNSIKKVSAELAEETIPSYLL
jgi:hypothetical protein